MKVWKNKIKIAAVAGIGLLAIAGCTPGISQNEFDNAIAEAKARASAEGFDNGVSSVDITSDNQAVIDSATADLNAKLEVVELEQAEADLVTEDVVKDMAEYKEDFFLGDSISLTLDDSDIIKLIDDEITVNGDDYDVHEELVFDSDAKIVGSKDAKYKDFEGDPYLVFEDEDALKYNYVFDDPVPKTEVSDDDALEIRFLGRVIKIVEITSNSLKVRTGTEYFLNVGEQVEVEGKTVKLVNVGSNGPVIVEVDGKLGTISSDKDKVINGIEVLNDETFYAEARDERSATLVIGVNAERDIEKGDSLRIFGEPKDEDDAEWVWDFDVTSDELTRISAVYNQKRDDLDDDFLPLKAGDVVTLPGGYLTITFEEKNNVEYTKINIEKSGNLREYSTVKDIFKFDGEEYDDVFLNTTTSKFYTDDTYATEIVGAEFTLDNTDLVLRNDSKFYDGSDVAFAESEIVDRDEKLLNDYGMIMDNGEEFTDDDEMDLYVPDEKYEVNLVIKWPE